MTTRQLFELTEAVVRVLLLGLAAAPRSGEMELGDESMLHWLRTAGGPAFAETWRTHERFLRSEAARLGITPPAHHDRRFYAEAVAEREAARR